MVSRLLLKNLPLAVLLGAVGCMPSESVDLELPSARQEAAGSGAKPDAQRPLIEVTPPTGPTRGQCFVGTDAPPRAAALAPAALRQTPATESAVPPISGGTMLMTADGSTVVAADPDRDQVYFVDAQGMRHLHTRALSAGDEPGRVVVSFYDLRTTH